MRMDRDALTTPSAADVVNHLPERALADLIWRFGEERHARRIAAAIARRRPLRTTGELAALVDGVVPKGGGGDHDIHPATRTFQALRIFVKQEARAAGGPSGGAR